MVFVEPLRSHCFHDQNDLYRVLSRRLSFSTYKLRTRLIRRTRGYLHSSFSTYKLRTRLICPTRGYLHRRRFFLEFFDFPIVFYQCEKLFTVFVEPLRSHCFFISKWFTSCFITAAVIFNRFFSTIGDDGIRQVGSDADVLSRVFWIFVFPWYT